MLNKQQSKSALAHSKENPTGKRKGQARSELRSLALCSALPLAFLALYISNRPFAQVLASKTVCLSGLSSAQKLNIENAARRLDGIVLKPGELFSFNGRVGERSQRRGYLPAPSYVERSSPNSLGGGICVLSSALYQDALLCGFAIERRVPHLKTIHTIAPGLDSTVWWRGADLAFRNVLACPVEIKANYQADQITVEMRGDASITGWSPSSIRRREQVLPMHRLAVTVTREQFGQTKLVSNDVYEVPTVKE